MMESEPSAIPDRKGWYRPRELPHFDGDVTQAVTFRLANSLPVSVLRQYEESHDEYQRRRLLERTLDEGHGEAWLARPEIADLVAASILHIGQDRCSIHAWVVMPTHVHLLFTPSEGYALAAILKTLKSFTALKANRLLEREGAFWAKEYHDRFIRNHEHYRLAVEYIHLNPVKAGLCLAPDEWRWSSAFSEAGRPEVDLPRALE